MEIRAHQLAGSPQTIDGLLRIRSVDENYIYVNNQLYPKWFFVQPLGNDDALISYANKVFAVVGKRTWIDGKIPSTQEQLLSQLKSTVGANIGLNEGTGIGLSEVNAAIATAMDPDSNEANVLISRAISSTLEFSVFMGSVEVSSLNGSVLPGDPVKVGNLIGFRAQPPAGVAAANYKRVAFPFAPQMIPAVSADTYEIGDQVWWTVATRKAGKTGDFQVGAATEQKTAGSEAVRVKLQLPTDTAVVSAAVTASTLDRDTVPGLLPPGAVEGWPVKIRDLTGLAVNVSNPNTSGVLLYKKGTVLPKANGIAFVFGDIVHWDPSTNKVVAIGGFPIGTAAAYSDANALTIVVNVYPVSASASAPVDVTPPDAPVISAPVETDDGVQVAGTAEPHSSVTVILNGVTKVTTANAGGVWSAFFTHAESETGTKTIRATAGDEAGNVSVESTRSVVIDGPNVDPPADTIPPDAPIISAASESDGRLYVSGTAEAASTVRVNVNGHSQTVTAMGSGSWEVFFPLSDAGTGLKPITASAVDAAGNVSPTRSLDYTVAGASVSPATFERPFSATSPWNIKPVFPVMSSAALPNNTYQPLVQSKANGPRLWRATASDAPLTIYPLVGRSGIGDPDIPGERASITIPHCPANAVPDSTDDHWFEVFDETTGIIHSFWLTAAAAAMEMSPSGAPVLRLYETAQSGYHRMTNIAVGSTTPIKIEFEFRLDPESSHSGDMLYISDRSLNLTRLSTVTGEVVSTDSQMVATSTSIGNGWFRVEIFYSGTSENGFEIILANNWIANYAGSASKYVDFGRIRTTIIATDAVTNYTIANSAAILATMASVWSPGDDKWRADTYGWTTLQGRGWGDAAHWYQGVRASGVPVIGGMIRKHEIDSGSASFDHALAMVLPHESLSSAAPGYVYPATETDTTYYQNTGSIPLGALMMLPPSFDVTALQSNDIKRIARTLKEYGARVVDRNSGTPFVIEVEGGSVFGHPEGSWSSQVDNDLVAIKNALCVVDSASGWVDRSGAAVTDYHPNGIGQNLVSMRNPWVRQAGTISPTYNSSLQRIEWGASGTEWTLADSWDLNTRIHPTWGKLVAGAQYRVSVEAENGSVFSMDIVQVSQPDVKVYQIPTLGHGQAHTFTWPAGNVAGTPYIRPGRLVPNSWIRIRMERLS